MSSMNIISGISCLVPLIAGIVLFRRASLEMRILTVFLVFVLFFEIIGFSLTYKNIDNVWLFHVYTLVEYSFLMVIFSNWQKNRLLKRILRLSILFFALIWLAAKLMFEEFYFLDNYTASLESILLLGVAFFTLFNLSRESTIHLYKEPRFWVSVAAMIYFSGSFMTFAFSNIIENMLVNEISSLPIHSILNIITNLCYAGGFLCNYPRLNYYGHLSSAL